MSGARRRNLNTVPRDTNPMAKVVMDPSNDSCRPPPPKVTVIIVNWNGGRFLQRCLAALQEQTVTPHEIILVDNASTDGSLDIARDFPFVRILSQKENLGFARGNNVGVMSADIDSEWIALLNPDAFPDPRWLEELLSAAEKHPGYDVFGSKLLTATEPRLLDGKGDIYHISGLVWRDGHGEPDDHPHKETSGEPCRTPQNGQFRHAGAYPLGHTGRCPEPVETAGFPSVEHGAVSSQARNDRKRYQSKGSNEIFSPCAAAAMYRKKAFEEAGGFDEDFFCYVEDVDLGFRLRLLGYRALYVPDSIAYHVGSATTGDRHSDFVVYHGHRNLVWTYVKNMPGILFWLLLPCHLTLNLVSIFWFGIQGKGPVIIKAKYDALQGIPRMWNKRRQIQAGRHISIRDIWHVLNKQKGDRLLLATITGCNRCCGLKED